MWRLARFRVSRDDQRALVRVLLALCALTAIVELWRSSLPSFGPAVYQYENAPAQTAVLPLSVPSAGQALRIGATVHLPVIHPILFSVVPDDCLESLVINGARVPFSTPTCLDHGGRAIWLAGKLHAGTNTIEAHIADYGVVGGLRIGVSLGDPVLLVAVALALAIGLWCTRSLLALLGQAETAPVIFLLVSAAFASRLPFAFSPGFGSDVGLISGWARSAVELGVATSYTRQVGDHMLPNYPPFSLLVFEAAGRAYRWLLSPDYDIGLPAYILFMKLPAICADAITAVLLFFVVRKVVGDPRAAIAAGAIYTIHPAVIYDSSIWGQVDSLFSLFVLAALAAVLFKHWALVGAFAALSLLTKMQALVAMPALALLCVQERRALWRALLGAAVTVALVMLPFLTMPALKAIKDVYVNSVGFYPVLSMSGYNAWVALFGMGESGRSDARLFLGLVSYRSLGTSLFGVFAIVLPLVCWRRFRRALDRPSEAAVIFLVPALTTYAFFLANTEMHERYLFALMPLGLPVVFASRRGAGAYAAASLLFFLNLLGVLPWTDVDRALFREFPNLPALIGACHAFVFGRMATGLRSTPAAFLRHERRVLAHAGPRG
jgi:Gpi18-like mannosyltransferase